MRRGLTLIEVVAATALLATLVAACVPLLRSARIALGEAGRADDGRSTERAADAVAALLREDTDLIRRVLESRGPLQLRWEAGERAYSATAHLRSAVHAAADERRSSHAWVVFDVEGVEVVRWLRIPATSGTPRARA